MSDTVADQMRKLNLNASIVDKRPAGTAGKPFDVTSNITPITLKKDVSYFKYDIRMRAIFTKRDGSEAIKEFAKQTRDDYLEQERKQACTEIFLYLVNTMPMFQGDLIYDRAAILFSTQLLEGITETEAMCQLPTDCQTVSPDAVRIEVVMKQASSSFQVSSNDLVSSVNADFKNQPKGLMEVLNLATSQIPFFSPEKFLTYGNGNIYLLDPASYGFTDTDLPPIGRDKLVQVGLSKGVKILEGYNSNDSKEYTASLVLDVKKTAFHVDNILADKIKTMYPSIPSTAILLRDLKGIRCQTLHKRASIVIGGFTSGPVDKASFVDKEGKKIGILEYYESRYHARIPNGDVPGVKCMHTGNIYPADLLRVLPNQRVKGTQATKETVETLIKASCVSAIKPDVRFKQTQRLSRLLEMNSDKAQRLGVWVPEGQLPLSMTARQLAPVKLLAAQGGMAGPSWRGGNKFVVGAKVEKWAAFLFYNSGGRSRYAPHEVFPAFCKKLAEAGNRKGMSMPLPTLTNQFDLRTNAESMLSDALKKAHEAGCTFVLVVSDEKIKFHDQLKYEEIVYQFTTQEVTLGKAAQVAMENKVQTLENIVMKTNMKLRGMNHVLSVEGGGLHHANDTIIMGIFVQQPRGMTAKEIEDGCQPSMPAVIGLSANNGIVQEAPEKQREMSAQQYFTTNWKYANPKEWMTGETQRDTLKKMIVDALVQFKDNRGRAPNKIVVYRGGASEGQLTYIAGAEKDVFLDAFKSLNETYNPVLVIIGCSKEHNERFYHKVFPTAPPGTKVDTNLPPGIIVDKVAVNPELNEFYLQSHKALQGTAKATKYTLLHESTGRLTNDQIQYMTNSLCHLHEIVNSTTSIPTPLYVAEESVKRGVNIYHHIKGSCDRYDLDEVNKDLSFHGLASRINA